MSQSLVSVIIPTHNRVELLKGCLESIRAQRYSPLEMIVVNDASSDDTGEYCALKCDDNLRCITTTTPCGAAAARNRALECARGDYIAFCDDDDWWEEDKLGMQIGAMEGKENIGMCYTGKTVVWKNRKTYSFKKPRFSDHFKSIMYDNFIGTTSSVCIPAAVLNTVGQFDTSLPLLHDYDLYIRICKHFRVCGIDKALVGYRMGGGGKQISLQRARSIDAMDYLLHKYRHELYYPLLKRALITIHLRKAIKSAEFRNAWFRELFRFQFHW
jgi:glycosyltransferase involved in cell wall biosynthesis